jgi:hypothetical protein
MKINIVGSIFGTSGYDSHCKQLANALYKLNPDIKLDVPLIQDWARHVNDAELKMINCPNRIPDTTIAIMTPPFWRLAMGDNTKKFIGFCVWEGSSIPQYWLEYLFDDKVDQIWVPSQHTKEAIWYTYFDNDYRYGTYKLEGKDKEFWDKIKIVPHGVDLSIFKLVECKKDNKFTFTCNKGWRGTSWDRGGVQYLLKAFCEEFKKEEDVQLILKLNGSYLHPSQLKQAMDSLQLPADRPEIKVIINDIPYNKLPEFYCMGDVFVCPTRAEAFGLTGLESMACGIPTIQTAYSGQTDYMTHKNALFISYQLEEVKEDMMYEGIYWATPDIVGLRNSMRWAFDNRDDIKQMGKQCLEDVKNWTWDISAQKAMDCVNELFPTISTP